MTVGELIAELKTHPPQKRVCVRVERYVVDTEIGEQAAGPTPAVDADSVVYEGAYVTIQTA